jgi:hypothetical protein
MHSLWDIEIWSWGNLFLYPPDIFHLIPTLRFWTMILVFIVMGLIPKLLSWDVYMPEPISWGDNKKNYIEL